MKEDYFGNTSSYGEIIAYLREINEVQMADAVLGLVKDLSYKEGVIETLRQTKYYPPIAKPSALTEYPL